MSRITLHTVIVLSFLLTAAQQDAVAQWGSQPSFFARVEPMLLKRDESDSATLATLDTAGQAGRISRLASEDIEFDYEPGMRVTIGMARDDCGCSWVEAEYFGVFKDYDGESDALVLPAAVGFGIGSPHLGLAGSIGAITADGETDLHNVELNFVRRGMIGNLRNTLLGGFRFLYLDDDLNLAATSNTGARTPFAPNARVPFAAETTSVNTTNYVAALQIGGSLGWCWSGLSITAGVEGFVYADFFDSDASNQLFDPTGFFGGTRIRRDSDRDETIGVGAELRVEAAYQVTQNLKVFGAWNLLTLSNLALASEQLPTIAAAPVRNTSFPKRDHEEGSLLFHGPSAGVELSW